MCSAPYLGLWQRKEISILRTYANSKNPDQCTSVQSGQDLHCSPTEYRDLVEDKGLILKILTRYMTAQTSLGLRYFYMPYGPFCQPAAHLFHLCERALKAINHPLSPEN